jgi:hypothetical protein
MIKEPWREPALRLPVLEWGRLTWPAAALAAAVLLSTLASSFPKLAWSLLMQQAPQQQPTGAVCETPKKTNCPIDAIGYVAPGTYCSCGGVPGIVVQTP